LQKDLEKLSNQARFIQMIIDGKLVVSKKQKAILVKELKQKNFTPFPKVSQAKASGELEPVVEDDDDEAVDADLELAASAYDYLLGVSTFLHYFQIRVLTFSRWPSGLLQESASKSC
jgi:DNA topoisomerase II